MRLRLPMCAFAQVGRCAVPTPTLARRQPSRCLISSAVVCTFLATLHAGLSPPAALPPMPPVSALQWIVFAVKVRIHQKSGAAFPGSNVTSRTGRPYRLLKQAIQVSRHAAYQARASAEARV